MSSEAVPGECSPLLGASDYVSDHDVEATVSDDSPQKLQKAIRSSRLPIIILPTLLFRYRIARIWSLLVLISIAHSCHRSTSRIS